MNFEKLYQDTPDSLKLKYMDAIIKQNNKLQEEFVNFVGGIEGKSESLSYKDFVEIIQDVQNDYKDQFESVDPEDPDWENYHPPYSGYIEDWEAYQYASEQEFEAIFEEFRSEALNLVIEQRPDKLTAKIIGLYEASLNVEIEDEVGSFDDVNEYLLSEHQNTLKALVDKLQLSALHENVIGSTFDLFIQYHIYEYPGNPGFAAHFEPFLIALAEKSENPARLLKLLSHPGVDGDLFPELLLLLYKKAGNATEWLKSAQRLYRNNNAVAKELLAHYHQTDKAAFLATAREQFETNKLIWAGFLQDYVTPELNRELFVDVFRTLTVKNYDLEMYKKIRELLTESEFRKLLDEINWNIVFKVNLLEIEGHYEEIKSIAEKYSDTSYLNEILSPIIGIYPEFCFSKIFYMTNKTLQNERGRHIYQQIASWLNLSREIPGFDAESQRMISQTYMHKPNLPALKDEMRKAGLVKG
jgi:hypothetical protein